MPIYDLIQDFSVGEALQPLEGYSFKAVIRSIDSSRKADEIAQIMEYNGIHYSQCNENICVDSVALKECLKKDLFVWFNEIWLFSNQFPDSSLKSIPFSTGDAMAGKSEIDPQVISEFEKVGCDIMLADGVDLCVIAKDRKMLDSLKSIDTEQS